MHVPPRTPPPTVMFGDVIGRTLTRAWRRFLPTEERGASLVEYALLVALIALVCVSALTVFGQNVSEPISSAQYGF